MKLECLLAQLWARGHRTTLRLDGRFQLVKHLAVGSALITLASLAAAQVDRAGLNGTVTDPSGRVLPQTHITAVHDATGLHRQATSSSTGTYDIPELPVGVYTVTFTHEGLDRKSVV